MLINTDKKEDIYEFYMLYQMLLRYIVACVSSADLYKQKKEEVDEILHTVSKACVAYEEDYSRLC